MRKRKRERRSARRHAISNGRVGNLKSHWQLRRLRYYISPLYLAYLGLPHAPHRSAGGQRPCSCCSSLCPWRHSMHADFRFGPSHTWPYPSAGSKHASPPHGDVVVIACWPYSHASEIPPKQNMSLAALHSHRPVVGAFEQLLFFYLSLKFSSVSPQLPGIF